MTDVKNNRAKSKNCTCGSWWTQPWSYMTERGAKMMLTKTYGADVKDGSLSARVIADENGRWHISLAVLNGGCGECSLVQQALMHVVHYELQLAKYIEESPRDTELIARATRRLEECKAYIANNQNGEWK